MPSGELNGALPRTACRRLLDELEAHGGLRLLSASEFEFSLADGSGAQPAEEGGWRPAFDGPEVFVTLQQSKAAEYCYALEDAMAELGVDVRTINCEYGAGQLEITYAPKWGIDAADAACTFRTGAKELAQRSGRLATFFASPFSTRGPCSGGHLNFSLWAPDADPDAEASERGAESDEFGARGMRNAMHDPDAADGLSEVGRAFIAGVLSHARAIEALCSPTPACYLRHGKWAPDAANWGADDRTAALRWRGAPRRAGVADSPADSPADPAPAADAYAELRMPSSAACPYLATAALVAAGLDGLERHLDLPPPRSICEKLPTSLEEALVALESDGYMTERLGPTLVRWYCDLKRAELAAVRNRIDARGRQSDRDSRVGGRGASPSAEGDYDRWATHQGAAGSAAGGGAAEESVRREEALRLEAWRHVYVEYI